MTLPGSKLPPLRKEFFEDKPVRPPGNELKEVVSIRISTEQGRVLDELVAILRREGSPIKTRSDVYRWAGEVGIDWLNDQFTETMDSDQMRSDHRTSWLHDHLIQARLNRDLADQARAGVEVKAQLEQVKVFARECLSSGNYISAVTNIERLADATRQMTDPIWSQLMRSSLARDQELRNICSTLEAQGYHTTLFRQSSDETTKPTLRLVKQEEAA